jgi:hypothetical protein
MDYVYCVRDSATVNREFESGKEKSEFDERTGEKLAGRRAA